MAKKSDPELPILSPIPFRHGCNGEYAPRPASDLDRRAEAMFRDIVDDRSRRLGISRRQFVRSASGTAAALLVINQVYGCGGGGKYRTDAAATFDAGQACEQLGGDYFVFDVQTHHVDPTGPWRSNGSMWNQIFGFFPQSQCGEADPIDCFDRDHFIREVFVNSETAVAVLSAVPAVPDENPLVADEQVATRQTVDMLAGSPRLITHGLVLPDRGGAELDGMQRLAEELEIGAWKVYTQFGGWWLDSAETGAPFIEKARSLGVKTICSHKGLTLPGFDPMYSGPRDIGPAAAAFPDVRFLVYHSGYEMSITEGPYNEADPQGVDTLIKSVKDAGLGPGSNVYAELGSTWRNLMTRPDQAAHVLGKLMVHIGEDNILWGTDSIWYGSPQDQIDAFKAFEISTELQEQYGYPALTRERKAKILGLSGAAIYGVDPDAVRCEITADQLSARKAELGDRPALELRDYGPTTRREFLSFLRARGGTPG